MIIAHLIGGNEIEGITEGIVIVNNEPLKAPYSELAQVCGNISLGDLDTSISIRRTSEHVQNDFIRLVEGTNMVDNARDFVINNHLTADICYSTYEIDWENKLLLLLIEIYG